MKRFVANSSSNSSEPKKTQKKRLLLAFSASPSTSSRSRISGGFTADDVLSRKMTKVSLKSEGDVKIDVEGDGQNAGSAYPVRPNAGDCQYYLRTGICGFESNCRFNHPPKRANQRAAKEDKTKEKEKEQSLPKDAVQDQGPAQFQQIQCKYFLSPGGCRYGSACRYLHSAEEPESDATLLNFFGLPIRPGEKDCPYYIRNGACGFGPYCRFHHPEPAEGAYGPYTGEMYAGEASQQGDTPWLTNGQGYWIPPDNTYAYQDGNAAYAHAQYLEGQSYQGYQNTRWNGGYQYQVYNYAPEGNASYPAPAPAPPANPIVVAEAPAKTVKAETDPPSAAVEVRPPATGLNQATDAEICRKYSEYKLCKVGCGCPFDHPPAMALMAAVKPSDG